MYLSRLRGTKLPAETEVDSALPQLSPQLSLLTATQDPTPRCLCSDSTFVVKTQKYFKYYQKH